MIRPRAEESEFREFVAGFSPTLLRAARLLVGDAELAQDVVQSTLERTFRRWRVARRTPEAYSRRVLVNVCRNEWRRQRRHPTVPADDRVPELVDAGAGVDDVEDRLGLRQALAALSPLHREVLVARFYLDLSVAETAELLRAPPGTVKSATHRALATLRAELNDPALEVPHAH